MLQTYVLSELSIVSPEFATAKLVNLESRGPSPEERRSEGPASRLIGRRQNLMSGDSPNATLATNVPFYTGKG